MKQLNWYQIFGKSNIPDGRTVLPTDDIQIWLNCANIWNKTYTTLAEVLADTDTLLALINSPNAVDYMVRSTNWVISGVPTMTDNTHPSGLCFADYSYSAMPPYYAFDKNGSTTWSHYGTLDLPAYLGYDFGVPVCVNKVMIHPVYNDGYLRIKTFKIQGSNDNVTYEDVYSNAFATNSSAYAIENFFTFTNTKNYRYYRLLFVDVFNSGANGVPALYELQFYSPSIPGSNTAMSYIGLNNYCANTLLADSTWCEAICNSEYFESVLNVKIPKMTSDTTPSGKAFGDSIETSYPAYKAMDGIDTSYALSLGNATNPTFGYTFTANRSIYLAVLLVSSSANSLVTYTCKLQGSNDEFTNDVHDITEAFTYSASINDKITVKKVCTLLSGSSSYRVINTARTSSAARFMAYTIQFYGREDV